MATYTIRLRDNEARRLQDLARESGLDPEELLQRGVAEWLSQPCRDFAEAAAYVVKKNADLYRRLS